MIRRGRAPIPTGGDGVSDRAVAVRRLGLLTLLTMFGASFVGTVSSASAEPPLEVRLTATSDDAVPLGAPVNFRAEVKNLDDAPQSVAIIFSIYPAGDRAAAVSLERWKTIVNPGTTGLYESRAFSTQAFATTGRFILRAATSEDDSFARLRFSIHDPVVRVPRFKNVTASTGLSTQLPAFRCGRWAAGAAWADVDSDQDLDLFVPRAGSGNHLWINTPGGFVDEGSARGVRGGTEGSLGAVFVDSDNDGDQDLYVTNDGPNLFYENDGTGHFSERAGEAGIDDSGPGQSAAFGDYDGDGFVDLYVVNHARCIPSPTTTQYFSDRLYHNEGDGTFSDATALLSDGSTLGAGFQAGFVDYDMDNDVDLYVANDFFGPNPKPNYLWRNDGGTFRNVSEETGTGVSINAMGLGVGDYNRDLRPDLALSNIWEAFLLKNGADGVFSNVAAHARVDRRLQDATTNVITWGVTFADLNNDGWEDLYFPAGPLNATGYEPNLLFTNAKNGQFFDHSVPSRAADQGVSRGVALADYDRDGRLDMYVVNQSGAPHLYRNVTSQTEAHWLGVALEGTVSNRDGCGATLIVRPEDSKAQLLRFQMCGGTSLASGADKVVHFGLGKRDRVAELMIRWPSGIEQVRRNFSADRIITVKEPAN